MTSFLPSAQQQAIFEDVASGTGNTVVTARAGCGKTTTIVKSFAHIPARFARSTLMVAFNKSIATELQTRAPQGVTVSTLHSYGLRQIKDALQESPKVDNDKMKYITRRLVGKPENKERALAVQKLCSAAKNTLSCEPDDIANMVDSGVCDLPEIPWDAPDQEAAYAAEREECVRLTIAALDACKEDQDTIDFDDMIWFPNIFQMDCQAYSRVFVDERQDLNPAQVSLVLEACREGGRILAVGDPAQAIYGFRGAGGADDLWEGLRAKSLPLSITYRCPKKIVELAQKYVPDFYAAPGAPEGKLEMSDEDAMLEDAQVGDFILSRTNAPLVPLCFKLLKMNKRVNIAGRDIGAKLAKVIDRARTDNVTQLIDRTKKWADREIARLTKLERDTMVVTDTADCIYALAEGASTVNEIKLKIEQLFADTGNAGDNQRITLSTTHKAKGLERDRVFVLRDTYMKWPGQEEENLFYVAITRAKQELYLVAGEGV